MSIYRGAGGAGDATNNATSQAILAAESAQQAAASAAAASASASQAATSATNSASSATASANSATAAASSANSASTSATNAANSATAAQTAQTAAELAETNAETAEANAETAEANATASASLAQDWATKTSGPVAGGEYSSKYNAQLAATSATNAANSATSASTSASAAATSATNADASASSASNSASTASTSATNAATSETNAASSATSAATSATSAASSASTATTQASNAASSATAAATSASNAATSETNAAASATSAASSASTATTQATNSANSAAASASSASSAAASAAAAAASYDSFDDRYLGSKTSDPTLDNDGNALVTGALYYNSVAGEMRVYDGAIWLPASAASQAILTVYRYTATAGQTTFSGLDDSALTLAYTVGSVLVTLNGVTLEVGTDVTATTGTSVVLAAGAAAGDEVNIYAFSTFDIANTYTQAQSDAKYLTITNPSYTGTLTGGTGVMNIGAGQIYKDASGNVGIGTSSPSSKLRVTTATSNDGISVSDGTVTTILFNTSSANGSLGTTSNHPMAFYTNNAERMRIDSSGNLLVGTTSIIDNTKFNFSFTSATNGIGTLTDTTATSYHMRFKNPNGVVGGVYTNGSNTTYTTSSDYRLKENIQPMTGALDVVQRLNPVTFNWKVDGSDGQGFIAHELQAVVPDCVGGEKDAVDAEGNPVYQGIDTSFLVATLTKAIQELKAELDATKAEVAALKGIVQ